MWENPDDFDEDTEAYTVSVMHHLHCLVCAMILVIEDKQIADSWSVWFKKGNIKQYFHNARRGDHMNDDELAHLSHCTEVLRQAVMCHADMALERPIDTSVWPQRVSVCDAPFPSQAFESSGR